MSWQRTDLPYYSIGEFYRHTFGKKVQKIPVSVAEDCPNRRGLKGMETCIFCDQWGSAAYPENAALELREQIRVNHAKLQAMGKAEAFLVYFQAYTNTFSRLQDLHDRMSAALEFSGVVGLVIGTRPDCLSAGVLRTWQEFSAKTFVSVELGVQSFFDDQLLYMKRGHDAEASIKAIHKIRRETKVDLGIHLMFGWPGETEEHVIHSARLASSLPIDNVKLHNLHVLKNTALEKIHARGEFTPIELPEYARRVRIFLQHLRPDIAVHRLSALSSRREELVAPQWTQHKMRTMQFIIDELKRNSARQGDAYAVPAPQITL